jgi:GAF domain-containing protein
MIWQGEVIGVIDVLRDERRLPFTPGDLDLLQLFANQAALVLENARLIDGGRQRVEQLSLLHELTLAAIGAESRPEFIDVLTRRMPELLHADSCMLTRWDPILGVPSHEGARGSMLEAISRLRAHPGERTLTASALEAGKALAIEQVADSDLLSPRLAAAFPTPSVLIVPLVVGTRRYGAIFLGFDGRICSRRRRSLSASRPVLRRWRPPGCRRSRRRSTAAPRSPRFVRRVWL